MIDIPRKSEAGTFMPLIKNYAASVGEELFELITALLTMIVVEQSYGPSGLGIYAYMLACLFVARYVASFGVIRHVERDIAASGNDLRIQSRLAADAKQTLVVAGLAVSVLLVLTAVVDAASSRIEERGAAYILIALIVPLANLNALKLAILQGRGSHTVVARFRFIRHAASLAGVLLLSLVGVAPSLLLFGILAADGVSAVMMSRKMRLPGWSVVFRSPGRVRRTLGNGYAYLLTDNGLDMILNIDLFVLGMFVSSRDLGVYTQAAVMARLFLVFPVGIKVLLRRRYTRLVAQRRLPEVSGLYQRSTVALFCVHAVLAFWIVIYFPWFLDFFFDDYLNLSQSYTIFTILLPGLLLYSAYCAQEPLYDALGQARKLKQLTVSVSAANAALTFFLVPAAGLAGAAAATVLAMFVHFLMFMRHPVFFPGGLKTDLAVAGLAVYLVCSAFAYLDLGGMVTICIGPLALLLLFLLIGLFQPKTGKHKNRIVTGPVTQATGKSV